MEVSRKKWESLKKRAATKTKGGIRNAKDAGIAGLVGFGGFYAHRELAKRVDFISENWYAAPLVMVAGGFAIRNKYPFAAGALCGAGGYAAGYGYEMQKAYDNANPPSAQGYGYDAGLAFEPVQAQVPALAPHYDSEEMIELSDHEAALLGV